MYLLFIPVADLLSEAAMGSVSKNTALIRLCIVMGKTISVENVHILDYL